ncbi:hypothetical protein GCM10028787_15860 [Brachybacterium horti]
MKRIEGSAETRDALGTTVCRFFSKWARKRRWISEVRMVVGVLPGTRSREAARTGAGWRCGRGAEEADGDAKAPVSVPEHASRGLRRDPG